MSRPTVRLLVGADVLCFAECIGFWPAGWILFLNIFWPTLLRNGHVPARFAWLIPFGAIPVAMLLALLVNLALPVLLTFVGRVGDDEEVTLNVRALLRQLDDGSDVSDTERRLVAIADEGNVDDQHLEARLWVWFLARCRADLDLERRMRIAAAQTLRIGGGYMWARSTAWRIRLETQLRSHPRLAPRLPPALPRPQ